MVIGKGGDGKVIGKAVQGVMGGSTSLRLPREFTEKHSIHV